MFKLSDRFFLTLVVHRTKKLGPIRERSNCWILRLTDVDYIRQLLKILINQVCFSSPKILEPRSCSMHQACKVCAQK